jgi:uncharacterized membrane protein YhaH (DUF805 family)
VKHALDLFSWEGRVGRKAYFVTGVVLFAIKYAIDLGVSLLFGRHWNPLMYVSLRVSPFTNDASNAGYLVALALVALPFLWIAISLSARRLRDMGVHPFWAGLQLLPFLNFAFMLVLAVCPPAKDAPESAEGGPYREIRLSAPPPGVLTRVIPAGHAAAFLLGLALSVVLGLICFVVMVQVNETLGGGLFVGVPFGMGFLMAFTTSYGGRIGLARSLGHAVTPIGVAILALLAVAWEGVACLIMALPILLGMALLGGIAGHYAARTPLLRAGSVALGLVAPTMVGIDLGAPPPPEAERIVSEIRIDAPPEVVWRSVVSFPPIDSPPAPIFAIVAMPIEAQIDGHDPGATRRCIFTNGEFVEPILVWDAPHELRFGVRRQPAHLGRYLSVRQGQFLLVPNADGSTTLRGTTWYALRVHPVRYWRAWTQTLLHAIHMRVLEHVKKISEHPELATGHPAPLPGWIASSNATCNCTRHAPGTKAILGY